MKYKKIFIRHDTPFIELKTILKAKQISFCKTYRCNKIISKRKQENNEHWIQDNGYI